MIKVEIGKTYYFEPYHMKGFKAKVTSIKDVKIYLDNDEKIEYEQLRMAVEIYPESEFTIITKELTFEDVKKLAKENGYNLFKHQESTTPKKKIFYELCNYKNKKNQKRLTFNTLQEVAAYFSPF